MNTLGALLAAAAGPLAKRVLLALGFGVVTYTGVSIGVTALLTQARTAWAGVAPDVAAYLALAGVNVALSLIAGAVASRVGLMLLKKMVLL